MTARIPTLTAQYVNQLRRDTDPTHRALAMIRAVEQHVLDLRGDDAGDDERRVRAALERITANLGMVEADLFALVKGV